MKAKSPPIPRIKIEQGIQLRKSLKLWHVVIIGLAYVTPMTVFDTFVLVSSKSDGHVPSAYLIALAGILFTALSYGKLVRQFPEAGSAYTYAHRSIDPHVGFMVGWLSLMDYLFLPMINVLLVTIYLSALFPELILIEPILAWIPSAWLNETGNALPLPHWIWPVLTIIIMTLSNIKGAKSVANLNFVLVFIQLIILLFFFYMVWTKLADSSNGFTLRPFFSENMALIPVISGATILCFSFLGFDGVTTLSEETANAEDVIPKAIFLIALYSGAIFVMASYFLQLYFPDLSLIHDPDNSLPDIAEQIAGKGFQIILIGCAAVGALASGIASHASISRLLFVMGRDRVFYNRAFAYLHPKWQTPVFNIIFVALVALLAIVLSLEQALSLVNFGALVAFTFVNLSVVIFFYIKQQCNRSFRDTIQYLISPSLGMVMIMMLWINIQNDALILGLIWAVVGLCYMIYLTKGFRILPEGLRKR